MRRSLIALAAFGAVAFPTAAQAKTTILMSGSTSVYPLEVKIAQAYAKKYPGEVKFSISQGGSDIGISNSKPSGRIPDADERATMPAARASRSISNR